MNLEASLEDVLATNSLSESVTQWQADDTVSRTCLLDARLETNKEASCKRITSG
jgi:hypothetical protein